MKNLKCKIILENKFIIQIMLFYKRIVISWRHKLSQKWLENCCWDRNNTVTIHLKNTKEKLLYIHKINLSSRFGFNLPIFSRYVQVQIQISYIMKKKKQIRDKLDIQELKLPV